MSELEAYLEEQQGAGAYQSTGTFAIDFAKAKDKRRNYTLPDPSLWIVRLLQGFDRLEVCKVDIKQGRREMTIDAHLSKELGADMSLTDLFRLPNDQDPRLPLQEAVWGATNRRLKVQVLWPGPSHREGFTIQGDNVERIRKQGESNENIVSFSFSSMPKSGLLDRLFGRVDFSGEFASVAQRGFLAPFPLYLDSRPYDFETSFNQHHVDGFEFRAHPARSGPRIKVSPTASQIVEFSDSNIEGLTGKEPLTTTDHFNYLFLLKIHWNHDLPRTPKVHWVEDGFVLHSEDLRKGGSPLCLDLYLPAGGLQKDLTNLQLIRNKTYLERLHHFEKIVAFSLLTTLPKLPNCQSSKRLVQEINRFFEQVKKRKSFTQKDNRQFTNTTKQYQSHKQAIIAQYARDFSAWKKNQGKLTAWQERNAARSLAKRKGIVEPDEIEMVFGTGDTTNAACVARWSSYLKKSPGLSRQRALERLDWIDPKPQGSRPEPEAPTIEEFLGGIYIRLPSPGPKRVQ